MNPAIERLKSEMAALSADERAELADFLMDSLNANDRQEIEGAWLAELHRRDGEFDRGDVQAIAGDQMFERLRTLADAQEKRTPGYRLERTSD